MPAPFTSDYPAHHTCNPNELGAVPDNYQVTVYLITFQRRLQHYIASRSKTVPGSSFTCNATGSIINLRIDYKLIDI